MNCIPRPPRLLLALSLLLSGMAVAETLHEQALTQLRAGHPAEALALARQDLAATQAASLEQLAVVTSLTTLADTEAALHADSDAETHYRQALSLDEKLHGDEQASLDASLLRLADFHASRYHFAEALPLYQRRVSIFEAAYGPDHPAVAERLLALAAFQQAQGHYQAAGPLFERALAIDSQEFGPGARATVERMGDLAGFYVAARQFAKAEKLYRRMLDIQAATTGLDPVYRARTLEALAELEIWEQEFRSAGRHLRAAGVIYSGALGDNRLALAANSGLQADGLRLAGKPAEAEPLYQQVLGQYQALSGTADALPGLLDHAALNSAALGQDTEALKRFAQAQALYRQSLGPESAGLAQSLNELADFQLGRKNPDAAEPLFRQALAMRTKVLGPDHPAVAESLLGLARMYIARRQHAPAESLMQQALVLEEQAYGRGSELMQTLQSALQDIGK